MTFQKTDPPPAADDRQSGASPHADSERPVAGIGALFLLAASFSCIAVAPLLMPDSYSMVSNTISESAAQGVANGWLARLGFLFLGLSVLVLVGLAGPRWGPWGRLAFRVYGVAMVATAVFSHMPWEDLPYDLFEDSLHSIAASTVGTSFTVGVVLVTFRRGAKERLARVSDVVALVAAVAITIVMFGAEDIAGSVQRVMFVIAYVWFGMEVVRSIRTRGLVSEARRDLPR